MNFNRDLLQAARLKWLALSLTILFGLGGGIFVILQARQLSAILNAVFIGRQGQSAIAPMILPLLVIFMVRALLTWLANLTAGSLAVSVKESLRSQLVEHLFNLGPLAIRRENTGELANTAYQGIEALDAYFSQYLPQVALAGLIPVTVLAFVFPIDWLSGLVMLLTAPIIPVFMILIGKASEAATRRQWNGLSRLSAYFLDTIQGLRELKLLGQSQRQVAQVAAASDQYRLATMNVLRVTFLSALVLELAGTLSTAVIAVQIGLRLLHGGLIFEQAFFILLLAPEFYLPLRLLGQRFHAGANGISAAKRIFTILSLPVQSPGHPAASALEVEPINPSTITFKEVSFTYPDQTRPAVHHSDFTLRQGEITALVGPSGAGKSTLAHLLLRFLALSDGQILIDGVSLQQISIENWRKSVAWVPQQPVIFKGTIQENIALGKPDASLDEIRTAAEKALIDDRVRQLPDGYQTRLGEGGARMSGGELQRLALARAFLLNAPILVLDEPTAHLDPVAESTLQTVVEQLGSGRTVLVIAHRLATITRADQILVLKDGAIVERGTHSGLIKENGLYQRLLRTKIETIP